MRDISVFELDEALHHRTFALFIGADLPREVTGLPSRADLARDLARRKGLDESLSLAEVAQRVVRGGNRWNFTAFIRDQLDTTGKSPQPFHRRIVGLVQEHGIETLITTAYDNLLELAFQEAGVPINRVVRGSDISFINSDRPTLIKLYGDAQQPDTLVVTEDDHSDLWRDRDKEDLLHEVRTVLRRQTVLFLGYNLADPDFNLLWREALDRAGRFNRTAYAVWPGGSTELVEVLSEGEVRMWRDRGIEILEARSAPLSVLMDPTDRENPLNSIDAVEPVPSEMSSVGENVTGVRSWSYEAGAGVASVAISGDGERVLVGTLGKHALCLDQAGGELWTAEVGNQAWRVAISDDGQVSIVGTGSTRPWDKKGRGLYAFDGSGQIRWHRDLGASVWGLALSAAGDTICAGTDGHEALLMDREGHLLWRHEVPGLGWWGWVWAAALSADGRTVALGAADRRTLILNRGGNLLGEHRAEADVFVTAISDDGKAVAAGSSDQHVYLLDRSGNLLWFKKLEDKVWAVALPKNGQRLIVGAGKKEGHVHTFDRGGSLLWKRYVAGGVSSVSVSARGSAIIVGTRTGHVHIFDGDGEPVHHLTTSQAVRDVAVSADGRLAAAVSEDGHVYGFQLPFRIHRAMTAPPKDEVRTPPSTSRRKRTRVPFKLQIRRIAGRELEVRALETPSGEPRATSRLPYNYPELIAVLKALRAASPDGAQLKPEQREALRDLGLLSESGLINPGYDFIRDEPSPERDNRFFHNSRKNFICQEDGIERMKMQGYLYSVSDDTHTAGRLWEGVGVANLKDLQIGGQL